MAQEEVVNVRVDPLGGDDTEELASRYRAEARMVGAGVGEGVGEMFPQVCFGGPVADLRGDCEKEWTLGCIESFGEEHPLHECKVLRESALPLSVWMRTGLEGGSRGLGTSKC